MGLVSRNEYATLKGVSHTAINEAVKQGKIPLFNNKIDPDVPNEWEARRVQHDPQAPTTPDPVEETKPGTKADSERRKEFVKAEIAEIELRKLRGELVEVADVKRATTTMITTVQTRILLVASVVAPKVAVSADVTQCERIIDVELRSALMELSQFRPGQETHASI